MRQPPLTQGKRSKEKLMKKEGTGQMTVEPRHKHFAPSWLWAVVLSSAVLLGDHGEEGEKAGGRVYVSRTAGKLLAVRWRRRERERVCRGEPALTSVGLK